jgi:hypothetical protein
LTVPKWLTVRRNQLIAGGAALAVVLAVVLVLVLGGGGGGGGTSSSPRSDTTTIAPTVGNLNDPVVLAIKVKAGSTCSTSPGCRATSVTCAHQTGQQFICHREYSDGYTDDVAYTVTANGDHADPATATTTAPAPPPPSGMTRAIFDQIQTGMSYDQVVALVGQPGTLQAETNIAGYDDKVYMWRGVGGLGANANVTFQNSQVVSKAQFGLS